MYMYMHSPVEILDCMVYASCFLGHPSSHGVCGISFDVPSSPEGAVSIRLPSTQPHQCHSHPDCCGYPLPATE